MAIYGGKRPLLVAYFDVDWDKGLKKGELLGVGHMIGIRDSRKVGVWLVWGTYFGPVVLAKCLKHFMIVYLYSHCLLA